MRSDLIGYCRYKHTTFGHFLYNLLLNLPKLIMVCMSLCKYSKCVLSFKYAMYNCSHIKGATNKQKQRTYENRQDIVTQSRIIIYVQGDTGIRNSLRCLRCSFVPNGLYFEVSIWNITVIPFEIKDAGMCKENPTDSAHRQLYMQTTQTLSLTPYVSRKFKRLTDQMLFSSIPC